MTASIPGDKTAGVADDLERAATEVRVSDKDREQTVERLRETVTDGTLTLDEFADRVSVVLASRTRGELDSVVSDLPKRSLPQTTRGKARRSVIAVMSGGKAKGRWRVGRSVRAVAFMGGCELDFRQAVIEAAEVSVTALAVMGGIEIVVPEGIPVELTGFSIMGGKHLKLADVPILPGSPLITIRAFPIMGGVNVRSKPSRSRPVQELAEANLPPPQPLEVSAIQRIASEPSTIEVPIAADGTVTIMFSDIAGYSEMNERLGDIAAHELLRAHNAILREQLATHGGQEVKSQGDGLMVSFSSATRALRCAVGIQRSFEKYSAEHPDEPIQVHIGLHTGEPIRDGGDLLGRTVITASRLSDAALPGEILTSSLLQELTNPTGEFRFGESKQIELKGISGRTTVYPVEWRS